MLEISRVSRRMRPSWRASARNGAVRTLLQTDMHRVAWVRRGCARQASGQYRDLDVMGALAIER